MYKGSNEAFRAWLRRAVEKLAYSRELSDCRQGSHDFQGIVMTSHELVDEETARSDDTLSMKTSDYDWNSSTARNYSLKKGEQGTPLFRHSTFFGIGRTGLGESPDHSTAPSSPSSLCGCGSQRRVGSALTHTG